MIGRALNADNDLFARNGQIAINSESQNVVQNVRSNLLFYLGEWFANTSIGYIDLNRIGKKPADLSLEESLIKTEILSVEGVREITAFSSNFERITRVFNVSFTALTIYDNIPIELDINIKV